MRLPQLLFLALLLAVSWLLWATTLDARAAPLEVSRDAAPDDVGLASLAAGGADDEVEEGRRAVSEGPNAQPEEGYFLDFYVTDPEGDPVPRVKVSAYCAGDRGSKAQTLEDEMGRYRLPVRHPLPTQLFFWNEDLTQLAAETARDYPVPSPEPAHVVLYPHGAVAGSVRYDDGSPYTESVWLLHGDGALVCRGESLEDDGSFTIDDLRPGTYRCFVEDWPALDRKLAVHPGETTDGVEFVVPREGSLRVVVQGSGQFVNYAEVELFDSVEHVTSDDADRNGNVVFDELRPGTYWVTACMFEEPNRASRERVEVSPGKETTVIVHLPELPITLRGCIFDGGDPIDGAELLFSPVRPVQDGFPIPGARTRYGYVDDRGNYEMMLDRTGVYEASALLGSQEHRLGRIEVSALGVLHHDFHLPSGSISGQVVGLEDHDQLTVWLREQTLQADGGRLTTTTDANSSGAFSFDQLPAGHYDIWASQPHGELMGLVGPSDLALAAGEHLEGIEIRATPAGSLDVIVRDADGKIAVEAKVQVFNKNGVRHPIDWRRRGARAQYRQLAPGRHLVAAQWRDQAALVSVQIHPGTTTPAEVTMKRGGFLLVRSNPQVQHRIAVYTGGGDAVTSLSPVGGLFDLPAPDDHLGHRTIGPLPPGSFRVVGLSDGHGSTEQTVELKAGRTLEVQLEF